MQGVREQSQSRLIGSAILFRRRFSLLLFAFLLGSHCANAQLKLEFAPEYFYWEEIRDGVKWVEESGFRWGLELSYKQPVERGWVWAGRTKVYYGSVEYDGGIQDLTGTVIAPLKSRTEYYGGLVEGRFGYRWDLGPSQFLDAMGGPGFEGWLRRLREDSGYDEYWFPIYLKLGVEIAPSKETGWIGALGLKLPVYTSEVVDQGRLGFPNVTLHPEIKISGYAEAGYKFTRNFSAVVYADSYWFAESRFEQAGTVQDDSGQIFQRFVRQPESKTYQIGLKIGWTF